jgi:hypothetical protein
MKTFPLRHVEPAEVQQILTQYLPYFTKGKGHAGRPGARPAAGAPGQPYGPALMRPQTPHIAVNLRTRTVFVRGTEQEISEVGKVLAVLDADPDQPAPEGSEVNVVRLRHAKVGEVLQTLGQLDLGRGVVPLTKSNALLILPAAQEEQVREVVTHLDTDAGAPRTQPAKRPTRPGKGPQPKAGR